MSTLDRLRAIANRAGAPTMDYAPDYVIVEQRNSLDWIAHEAAEAIKELLRLQKAASPDWDRDTRDASEIAD